MAPLRAPGFSYCRIPLSRSQCGQCPKGPSRCPGSDLFLRPLNCHINPMREVLEHPILGMKRLRHREVKELAPEPSLVSCIESVEPWILCPRQCVLDQSGSPCSESCPGKASVQSSVSLAAVSEGERYQSVTLWAAPVPQVTVTATDQVTEERPLARGLSDHFIEL